MEPLSAWTHDPGRALPVVYDFDVPIFLTGTRVSSVCTFPRVSSLEGLADITAISYQIKK